ncbi:hypothetical protein Acr_14g0003290 [Actinidia rufa]|uniref:Transmembrane protein n=1 Tax=Actinidia rufa TaxID=165716 RepID=A0A7J0FQ48_9ERIC|nr:hypothetical protein Acr_14g0003170 [Actinidia rufa]GFZ00694.1 hypothetical protein Acr_14g0003290 [Actinidia rufa]
MKMKTFIVVLLVTLILVPETLQANAKGLTLANRRLLSDGDNDANQSYGKFGHGPAGSSPDTHHVFPNQNPPVICSKKDRSCP